MGGVDLFDLALSYLRPAICGKMWYWPLVINSINIAFVYSWRLYRILSDKTIPQKDFRRHIVRIMIRQPKTRIISVDSRWKKAQKVMKCDLMGYVSITSPAQFENVLLVGEVTRIHVRSTNLHVKTCFQIFYEKWQYNGIITTTCIIFII